MIDILERYTRAVLYHSDTAQDITAATREAAKGGANLSRADLSRANLSRADLSGAYLSGANLSGAYLPEGTHIMQVLGSVHGVVAIATTEGVELRIGCHHKSMAEWQKHYKAIGRANGYTPAQIKEYGAHITYAAWWAKHLPKLEGRK